MDGASKFVKGDAIAGIIILIINLIGGFIIGMTHAWMSFAEATRNLLDLDDWGWTGQSNSGIANLYCSRFYRDTAASEGNLAS